MLKAVLFDMDGVIVDTEPLHRKAYFKMFDDVNIEVSQAMYDSFTGQATLPICRTLCQHFNLSDTPEHLVSTKRKHFKYLFENDSDLALLDGVHDLIKNYHENGLTLVLASSASMPNINRIFERFDLDKYFKAKISGADAKAANIYCVGFKSPHSANQDYSKADRVISSFEEIQFSNLKTNN
jgi:beta-phosphoglucomutase-like phosphatase (HAD superfamily)